MPGTGIGWVVASSIDLVESLKLNAGVRHLRGDQRFDLIDERIRQGFASHFGPFREEGESAKKVVVVIAREPRFKPSGMDHLAVLKRRQG